MRLPRRGPRIDGAQRDRYRAHVRHGRTTKPAAGQPTLTFCVYTDDLDEGRGDVYVAVGLGLALARLGWHVSYVPRSRWGRRISGRDVVVSMLPSFDPRVVDDRTTVIGWARNETEVWARKPYLECYDGLLASSELTRDHLAAVTDLPVGLLAIGVDEELFHERGLARGAHVVTSVNHWGRDREIHRALAEAPPSFDLAWYCDPARMPPELRRWVRGHVSYFALPDVYGGARLVIDDCNHTTLPFGNVNSRVFESLAAGALPVTNSATGLAELGLEQLPRWDTADDLLRVVAERREDRLGTVGLTTDLRRLVLERHTFRHRAQELLDQLPLMEQRVGRRTSVGFYPDYRATNPFQDMLFDRLPAAGFTVRPVANPVTSLEPRPGTSSADGYVFNLHWTAPLLQSAPGPNEAMRRALSLRRGMADLQQRGGRVVWTIHNVVPHECHFLTAELELCRDLAQRADAVHVLGEETARAAALHYDLPADRTVVIPHSSYVGVYPELLSRQDARRRLGLVDSEVALLLLGGIRPYKGFDTFVDVFDELSAQDPRLRLLVAGRPGRSPGTKELVQRLGEHPRVLVHAEEVDDADLQVWCLAADLAVLPYPTILNSGVFELALSFGLPLVAPRTGNLAGRAETCVSWFDPLDAGDLRRATVRGVDELVRPDVRRAARQEAARRPVAAMADAFADLCTRLVAPEDAGLPDGWGARKDG